MIPRDYITEWRDRAPWIDDAQVEQDLVISRALVEIFRDPALRTALAFRGGTALYKLYLTPAARYSEDIDLVQIDPAPIGATLDGLRRALDPWLGEPRRSTSVGGASLVYRFESEGPPSRVLRVKVEINSREHFSVFGLEHRAFEVASRWFRGSAQIPTFAIDELLGTKLRALYQRRKGRDLFDLWTARERGPVDSNRVVDCFRQYLDREKLRVSRADFEKNLAAKVADIRFGADIVPLIAPGNAWDVEAAVQYVREELIARLPAPRVAGRVKRRR